MIWMCFYFLCACFSLCMVILNGFDLFSFNLCLFIISFLISIFDRE